MVKPGPPSLTWTNDKHSVTGAIAGVTFGRLLMIFADRKMQEKGLNYTFRGYIAPHWHYHQH